MYMRSIESSSIIKMILAEGVKLCKVSGLPDDLRKGSPQCCTHESERLLSIGRSVEGKVELGRRSRAGVVVERRSREKLRKIRR